MPHIAKNYFWIIFINYVIIYSIFSHSPSQYWQPGQTLLPTRRPSNYTDANGDYATLNNIQKLTSVLQSFQESLDSKLGSFPPKLTPLAIDCTL